ncbi:MAG: ATP synthase F1 subunit delta [Veillonella sp.]|uniref:ATP synthase F1 subunit delta n=1 Tax=Veillonella sp. TaxID=1926307 RepID=UPI002600E09B|nr:ATP synthase F1 subunit delta [Veillonella sp.]MBE6080241.1 ATP synthase F1 subunit delta [Veillonella sp.]
MSVDIVTDKYSTAIFELAQEQQILEQMETDLSYVKEVMDTQPELGTLLLYPALDAEAKCNVLAKIFGGAINTMALNTLFVMVKRGRIRYIQFAIAEFINKAREARGIFSATVTVSEAMPDEIYTQLADKLKAITGKQYIFTIKVDPTILGGFIIQIGDTRIDASLMRRMEDLKKYLLKSDTTEIGVNG